MIRKQGTQTTTAEVLNLVFITGRLLSAVILTSQEVCDVTTQQTRARGSSGFVNGRGLRQYYCFDIY